jgi:DNA modification methylase
MLEITLTLPASPPVSRATLSAAIERDVAIVQGESLDALAALASTHAGAVTLAYLDPPFFTGREHLLNSHAARGKAPAVGFDDRWPDFATWLAHVRDRAVLVRDLLAPHGSIVVHVDPKTSGYLRVLLDSVFGRDAFQSEIVWRYRRWPARTPNFQRVHDVMLRWVRDPSAKPRFVQLYEPLAESTRRVWGTGKQRAIVSDEGRRTRSSTTEEASPGVPMGDVWEIGIVAPSGKERTGYPTQKPEALATRLVSALSAPGDLVLDPTMGSGTTLVAAATLGRRAIGIDRSDEAIRIATARLVERGLSPQSVSVQT